MATPFAYVYNRFLGKITDDMYVELTPEDTIRDLRNLLIAAIPQFEFPRVDLFAYKLDELEKAQEEVTETDFIIGTVWNELDDEISDTPSNVIIENSSFEATLTSEEINILAIIMKCGWVQRQVTSIENTRMKYSGADFKMTSQANHLAKLLSLLTESQRDSHHMQRLYKRRRFNDDKRYRSNWDVFGNGVYSYGDGYGITGRPIISSSSLSSHTSSSTTIKGKSVVVTEEEKAKVWGELDDD